MRSTALFCLTISILGSGCAQRVPTSEASRPPTTQSRQESPAGTDAAVAARVRSWQRAADKACPDPGGEAEEVAVRPTPIPQTVQGALTVEATKQWIGGLEAQVAETQTALRQSIDRYNSCRSAVTGDEPQTAAAHLR